MAIGDIRSVISAEAAYQSANGNYYDTLECMGAPTGCIPNYTGPVFVDSTLSSGALKGGYKRTFHPGPAAPSSPDAGTRSPSSMTAFAYTAVPAEPNRTGIRGFCGDSSGRICVTMDGTEPKVVNGECAPDCRMLN